MAVFLKFAKQFICISQFTRNLRIIRKRQLSPQVFFSINFKRNRNHFKSVTGLNATLISSVFLVKALSWSHKSAPDPPKLLEKVDDMYDDNRILELYDFLIKYKNETDDEILWRLARATYEKSKIIANNEEKKILIYEAFDLIKKSLELNDSNFAVHKWYAILLDVVGKYEGTKTRIQNAFVVKDHLKKASEINPRDAVTMYSLGYWCFLFADMPWYQRKIASVVFTSPPSSTFDEALYYFQKAEEIDPNFYSMNLLMLGKTFLRMNNTKLAFLYLSKAVEYPVKTQDDKEAHEEALKLIASLGHN